MMDPRRTGAALVMALLLLVVLDCIVLGTLHISLQEHRIGQNRRGVLQLRLDAESALRQIAGTWPEAFDSVVAGGHITVRVPDIPAAHVDAERLGEDLYVLDAAAVEPAPRAGRATARLLVRPPVLPRGSDPAAAPLSAGALVRVLPAGTLTIGASACDASPPDHAVLLSASASLIVEPGGIVQAPAGLLADGSLTTDFTRLAALSADRAGVSVVSGDTVVQEVSAGILIVDGNLTLDAGARHDGLVIVRGSLTLGAGAVLVGAAQALGGAVLGGELRWDRCVVEDLVEAARFRSATPAGARPRLPSFGP